MRPVFLTVPAIAAAVLFTGAACSATAAPAADQSAAPVTTATTAPASGSGGGAAPATRTTAATKTAGATTTTAGRRCRTTDLSATVTLQPEPTGGSTRRALVTLTNTSRHPCVVDGWASISLVNAADEVVPVRTAEVRQPGAPVRTTLRTGRTAWAGIKWTSCDKGDASCGAGNTLRFTAPASTGAGVAHLDGFPRPETSDITMKNLQIGSLQPSSEGVVAW
jgi:hypothetical protein